MSRTIAQKFGTGSTVDYTNASDPVLQIPFSALATASNWDTAPTSGTEDGEKWFSALLQQAKADADAVTDESNDVVVEDPFKISATRNSLEKVGFSYNVTIYVPDQSGTAPDPDAV